MDHAEVMLDKLMQAAREVGGAAWPLYVERIYAGAVVQVFAPVALISVFLCIALATRNKPMFNKRGDDPSGWAVVRFSCLIAAVLMLIPMIAGLPTLIAPEGEAISRLVGK